MQTINARLTEANLERDKTAAELAAIESNLEVAAQCHAEAVAAVELGEEADIDATAAELEKARAALVDEINLRQKLRTQAAVADVLGHRASAAHAAYTEAAAELKAAKVEMLRLRTKGALLEADRLVDVLADKSAELVALSGLLNEHGSPWQGGAVFVERAVTPAPEKIFVYHAELAAEMGLA